MVYDLLASVGLLGDKRHVLCAERSKRGKRPDKPYTYIRATISYTSIRHIQPHQ